MCMCVKPLILSYDNCLSSLIKLVLFLHLFFFISIHFSSLDITILFLSLLAALEIKCILVFNSNLSILHLPLNCIKTLNHNFYTNQLLQNCTP